MNIGKEKIMNKKRIIIISSIITLLAAVLVIVTVLIKNKTKRYEVPVILFSIESDIKMIDEDAEKYAKHIINKFGSDYCKKAYAKDKNIVIYFTEKQRKKALNSLNDLLYNDMQSMLDDMLGYRVTSISSDYRTMDVMFNENYDEKAFDKISECPTLLLIQIYEGETADAVSVTVNAVFSGSEEVKSKVINVENLYQ